MFWAMATASADAKAIAAGDIPAPDVGPGAARATGVHGADAAVPRHGVQLPAAPGDAGRRAHRADVQVEPGAGAGADRAGAGHQLLRRADDEPRAARPPGLGTPGHVVAAGHGRRRGAAAARPRREDRQVAGRRRAVDRLRAHRDARHRDGQQRPLLPRQAGVVRAGDADARRQARRRRRHRPARRPGHRRAALRARPGRHQGLPATGPTPPPRASATGGSTPATSPGSTTTASCSSSTGPRTWCCAAARTSTARRSRRRSTSTTPSPRPPCSACPTSGSARTSARSSCCATGPSVDADELRAFLDGRIAKHKIPATIWFRETQLPRNANGKFLKRELRAELLGT